MEGGGTLAIVRADRTSWTSTDVHPLDPII